MNIIDYSNLGNSVNFYLQKGYQNIEVPWYVSKEIMEITKPKHIDVDNDYYIPKNNKYLVASAEQSFIYMMVKGQLPNGYYQGITPCYRFEEIDSIHRKCFMKNELIYVCDDIKIDLKKQLDKIISDAKIFFEEILKDDVSIETVPQDNSIINFDLVYKGYELGSYGIRSYKNLFQWVYGTGCAEPRLSIIKKI